MQNFNYIWICIRFFLYFFVSFKSFGVMAKVLLGSKVLYKYSCLSVDHSFYLSVMVGWPAFYLVTCRWYTFPQLIFTFLTFLFSPLFFHSPCLPLHFPSPFYPLPFIYPFNFPPLSFPISLPNPFLYPYTLHHPFLPQYYKYL